MLFHEELNVKLIRFVKENPMLYDHNHEKYMDVNAKELAWQKIGDELKRSACTCKLRWINIRDAYRRMLRKSLESGHRSKPYKYENEISFLRPYYKDMSTQFEEFESDDISSNQGNNYDDEDCNESADSDELDVKPKLEKSHKFRAKKKERNRLVEEVVDAVTPTLTTTTNLQAFVSSDPVDAFLLSIGATLKTFSAYHLNLAKSKIFSIVQEHDLQQIVQKEQPIEVITRDQKISGTEVIFIMQ